MGLHKVRAALLPEIRLRKKVDVPGDASGPRSRPLHLLVSRHRFLAHRREPFPRKVLFDELHRFPMLSHRLEADVDAVFELCYFGSGVFEKRWFIELGVLGDGVLDESAGADRLFEIFSDRFLAFSQLGLLFDLFLGLTLF